MLGKFINRSKEIYLIRENGKLVAVRITIVTVSQSTHKTYLCFLKGRYVFVFFSLLFRFMFFNICNDFFK